MSLIALLVAFSVQAVTPLPAFHAAVIVCSRAQANPVAIHAALWEAEQISYPWNGKDAYKLVVPRHSQTSAQEQFRLAREKLSLLDQMLAGLVEIEKNMLFSGQEVDTSALSVPQDIGRGIFPKDCEAKGLAGYSFTAKRFEVDSLLFTYLETYTDVAAAWMQASLYQILQEREGHSNSLLTRRLVGCLFSKDEKCLSLAPRPFVAPKDHIRFTCADAGSEISLVAAEAGLSPSQWTAIFEKVESVPFAIKPIYEFKKVGACGDACETYRPKERYNSMANEVVFSGPLGPFNAGYDNRSELRIFREDREKISAKVLLRFQSTGSKNNGHSNQAPKEIGCQPNNH